MASCDEYIRLQDWAFVQGFALAKESSRPARWILHYIHHHDHSMDTAVAYPSPSGRTAQPRTFAEMNSFNYINRK